jgi:hypothetical protein
MKFLCTNSIKEEVHFTQLFKNNQKKKTFQLLFLLAQTCPYALIFKFFYVGTFAQFCTIKSCCMYIILIGV